MSLYSRLDRIAADVARLDRQLTSVSNHPQAQRTSVEGGSIDFNDSDGNLKAIVGEQEDGGTTIHVISGPTPPTPTNFTVDADHGKFIVHWSGDFDGDALAPSDWARAEVHASQDPHFVPDRTTARGSIVSAAGGEVTIGVLKGPWTIKMLAWSQAGKMSAPSAPADVEVPGYGEIVLEEIDAANTEIKNGNAILVNAQDTLGGKLDSVFGQLDSINDDMSDLGDAVEGAITSANGKNKVTYSDRPPTPADPGIFDDTWFVGQVGRPNDVVEATNYVLNPSVVPGGHTWGVTTGGGAQYTMTQRTRNGLNVARATVTSASGYVYLTPGDDVGDLEAMTPVTAGETISASMLVACSVAGNRNLRFGFRNSSGAFQSWSADGPSTALQADGDLVELKIENVPVPSGAAYAYVHTRGPLEGQGNWIEGTHAQVVKSTSIGHYFDGDTEDGATDNESHYRWTGTPHASTSEKYLPATDGLSDKWNVTEQYRHDGSGWVQVELSHNVISSVDIGALTAGSAAIKEAVVERLFADVVVSRMSVADEFIGENAILTGAVTAPKITASEELWAKLGQFVKIRSEQLESDAIDSMVITSPTIQSARSGRRWVAGPDSIRVINENDDVRTELSPDGSTFKGEVEAETLVVNDGAEFKANNTLSQGAHLLLAAGVTDPTAPPVVQPFWDSLELDTSGLELGYWNDPKGLAFDGTNYWTASGVSWGGSIIALRINGSTGVVDSLSIPDVGPVSLFGVTCIGSELFWLYLKGYKAFVVVTDLSCVKKREWEYPVLGYSPANPLVYEPGIGNDGTNVVTVQCTDAGRFTWRAWNKTTGAQISYGEEANDNAKSDFTGVHVGAADWGSGTWVTALKSKTGELVSFNTSGVYDGTKTFKAASSSSTGIVYAGGKFRTLDPAGKIHEYADNNTGDDSGDWWAVYRWWKDVNDNNVTNSAVDYLSRISPGARFTWPRRASIRLTGQPMPDGVDYLAPSLAKKATTPALTDYHNPAWYSPLGISRAEYPSLPADWATRPSPEDTNNFPESESSVLESASGTFRVQGDGSGHWGPLTMGRNGVMSGLIVTGTVLVQPDQDGYAKKVTISLPAARFTKPPIVWVQASTSVPHNVATGVILQEISTTTFNLYMTRIGSTTATAVTWFATDSE